jgi:hypothetical protein
MSRHYADRISTSADTSGSLKDVLRMHAYERCRHFFSYLYTARLLTDYVNAKHGLNLKPTDVLEVTATDQLDTGVRSNAVEYYGFNAKDPNVVDQLATACGRMDAAHYCNLGIDLGCRNKFGALAGADPTVRQLFEALKVFSGDTRLLPQRINIGPDKVIDRFHGELATAILGSGKPPVTTTNLKAYVAGADKALKEYADKQKDSGNFGIVACVEAYCACYANDLEKLWGQIYMNALGECQSVGAKQEDYVVIM